MHSLEDVVMVLALNNMLYNLWLHEKVWWVRSDLNVTTQYIFKLGPLVVAGHATISNEACFWVSHVCQVSLLISVELGEIMMQPQSLIWSWVLTVWINSICQQMLCHLTSWSCAAYLCAPFLHWFRTSFIFSLHAWNLLTNDDVFPSLLPWLLLMFTFVSFWKVFNL